MNLPQNYIHISHEAAVHIKTIRRFAKDAKALMGFIANAEHVDFKNPDELKEMFSKSGDSREDHIRMIRELAAIQIAISDRLEDGAWPDDEPEPLWLRDAIAKQEGQQCPSTRN